jgi:hypothetical protein
MRIALAGGFINPTAQLYALPELAIYGDGTVLAQDFSGTVGSGGVVPVLVTTRLTEAGLQMILAAAADAGLLGKNAQYQGGPMAEASTTTFTVVAEGHTHTVSVLALGRPGGDPNTQAIRDKLAALEAALMDVPALVGNGNVAQAPTAYAPTALEVFVSAAEAGAGTTLDWPLATPLASFGEPVRQGSGGGGINQGSLTCGLVSGADLATLAPLIASAAPDTVWTSGTAMWSLTFRPLLPDETGCPGV